MPAKYKITIKKRARKFIDSQTEKTQRRIITAIYELPHHGDITTISGSKGQYRLRVGTYRILYTVDHGELTVCVVDADNRGDVYK